MVEKKVMKLASRGKRFAAACIDTAFPFVAYLILVAVLAFNGIKSSMPGYGFGNDLGYGYGYGYGYNYGYGSRLGGASAAVIAIIFIVLIAYIVVEMIYYAKGQSIGKAILGLQVVSSLDGKPFRFWKMMLRECVVKGACGSVFALGYIWILIDDKNRGWHDKILDSYVVDLKESEKLTLKRSGQEAPAAPEAPVVSEIAPAPEASSVDETVPAPETSSADAAASVPENAHEPETSTTSEITCEIEEQASDMQEGPAEDISIDVETDASIADIGTNADELSLSMKKSELLAAAEKAGVKVSSRLTKEEIIEAVRAASGK